MNITVTPRDSRLQRATVMLAMVLAMTLAGCQQRPDPASKEVPKDQPDTAASDESEKHPPASGRSQATEDHDNEHADADQHNQGEGVGKGRGGRGMGRGRGGMNGFRPDMTTIHAMFAASDKIDRTVKMLPDGAEATTESDDEEVAALIQEHVPAMERRVLTDSPLPPMTFHPIFVNLIKHSKDYTLKFEDTENGMKVVYKADDPFVIMLVQEHARLVSRFLKNGMSEIHKPYTLPKVGTGKDRKDDQKRRALSAKKALFERLSTRLIQAMSDGGPVNAIDVCGKDAARLADEVSREHGVKIGRTSFRLRNPANTPPQWAAAVVRQRVGEPKFLDLPDGKLGAMLPIKLMSQCIGCHGSTDQIDADVLTALADGYPSDRATGFKVDELRGWFWVEVP